MGKKQSLGYWDSEGPIDSSIRVEEIDPFDARGKRRVYGRGDIFDRLTLNIDVWRSRNGRLFVRFWSRSAEVDWRSYEIFGSHLADLFPKPGLLGNRSFIGVSGTNIGSLNLSYGRFASE